MFKSFDIDTTVLNYEEKTHSIEIEYNLFAKKTVYIRQLNFDTSLYHKLKEIEGYKWDKSNKLHTIPEEFNEDLLQMLNKEGYKYKYILPLANADESEMTDFEFCSPVDKRKTTPPRDGSKNVYKKRSLASKINLFGRKLDFSEDDEN